MICAGHTVELVPIQDNEISIHSPIVPIQGKHEWRSQDPRLGKLLCTSANDSSNNVLPMPCMKCAGSQ